MWLAKVYITLKGSVLDPQGSAVQKALEALGYPDIHDVRVGKYLELSLSAASQEVAASRVEEMCQGLLANPVIERYTFTLEAAAGQVTSQEG